AVWAFPNYTETRTISRKLVLVKVSIPGPDYFEGQLAGGPSHRPRNAQAGPTIGSSVRASRFP
ncbi:hypothetical protein V8E53_004200, partial [Lactarius tabidus]